jgi:pyruvate/2-oxoglutarate/acetoin dehydrogenase E1 component/TPP-dependent pyruvate/acetoin dehydrogenase alpha subunit
MLEVIMPTFQNTKEFYEIMDATLRRVQQEPEVAGALRAGDLVVRFRYHEPQGEITIDLTRDPIAWTLGPSDLDADVEMSQSGDTSHLFWLGSLNVPRAIATRKVVSRGSVPKALALLPAVKPVFEIYEQVLRDLGHEDLIPREEEKRERKGRGLRALFRRRREVTVDYQALNRHLIPLIEGDLPEPGPAPVEPGLPAGETDLKVEMLRRMRLIRAFEEKLSEADAKGLIPTEAIHLSIGQEATAVGACFALRGSDYMATTHRGHGHMLAKGADLQGMMSELMGKADGLCGGKGGSMHVTQASIGALGANGIVGAPGLIATGAALSAWHRGSGQVAAAFMGDGATNQGMFHEALNLAAVLDLPAVFVVENNLYGEFTPLERHTRVTRLADRAAAYGIPGEQVDGNDVWAVYEAVGRAVERARRGGGPTLLECLTYRWHGHMEGETATYRDEAEIASWRERCPISRLERELLSANALTEAEASALHKEAVRLVEEAFAAAMQGPEPPPSALLEHVYAPEPARLYHPSPGRGQGTMRNMTCAATLWEALAEEMARDPRVFLLGEDVTTGGYFGISAGLADEFGPGRVMDTPISEYAIVGAAVGAAMTGMRPVAEILFSDFLTCCMDPIANQAAKLRYMSGGQYRLPLVVRTPGGAGLGMAAQHSQSWEALLTGIPGLIVVAPGTPADAKGLLKAAIRSNNPVLFFENKLLYLTTGPVPEGEHLVPLGVADIKRQGQDVTLVTVGAVLSITLEAAEALAREGVDVEVVDLRTLVPCDWAAVVRSTVKTGRLAVIEEGALTHGFGAEVVARVAEAAWGALKASPTRVAGLDAPIAYNRSLENAAIPDVERIVTAVQKLVG